MQTDSIPVFKRRNTLFLGLRSFPALTDKDQTSFGTVV
jgi:hypothetical protein